jgi:hypothetical protein
MPASIMKHMERTAAILLGNVGKWTGYKCKVILHGAKYTALPYRPDSNNNQLSWSPSNQLISFGRTFQHSTWLYQALQYSTWLYQILQYSTLGFLVLHTSSLGPQYSTWLHWVLQYSTQLNQVLQLLLTASLGSPVLYMALPPVPWAPHTTSSASPAFPTTLPVSTPVLHRASPVSRVLHRALLPGLHLPICFG